jgi:hypothetical protein
MRQQEIQNATLDRVAREREAAREAREQYEREKKRIDSELESQRRYLHDLYQGSYKEPDWTVRRTKSRIKDLGRQRTELKSPPAVPR